MVNKRLKLNDLRRRVYDLSFKWISIWLWFRVADDHLIPTIISCRDCILTAKIVYFQSWSWNLTKNPKLNIFQDNSIFQKIGSCSLKMIDRETISKNFRIFEYFRVTQMKRIINLRSKDPLCSICCYPLTNSTLFS